MLKIFISVPEAVTRTATFADLYEAHGVVITDQQEEYAAGEWLMEANVIGERAAEFADAVHALTV